MALQDVNSSQFSTSNQYIVYWIEMIENSTDTASNLSNITVRVWAKRTNTGYTTYGTGTLYCTIAGSQYTAGISSSQKITSTAICLFEKNLNIGHNGDGTGRVDISARISMDVVSSSDNSWGFGLTTIPRASQPSLSASTADMGTAITINMNRASTSFTHTVKYSFGSDSATIATGVTDSTSWTIPLTLANQIPSATSGWGTIIVDTYSGGTLIGTKSVTFTANCPSTMVPTFTSVTHSEANTTVSGKAIGSYVQGMSQLKMTINGAAGTYGSTISKYDFTVDGTLYSGTTNIVTSNAIKTSGTLTLTATITDSRGRTATKTASVTVLAYAPPSITSFTIARCDSAGNLNSMGDYVKVTRGGTWSVLSTKNTCSIVVKTSPRGTNTWTTKSTVAGGTGGSYAAASVVVGTYAATSSFDFRLEFTDLFNTTISLTVLSTGVVTMSWSASGVGIGKVWEKDTLDVGGRINAEGGIRIPDTRDAVDAPQDVPPYAASYAFKRNTSAGSPPETASPSYSHIMRIAGWDTNGGSGGWPVELSFSGNGVAIRQGTSATAWSSWVSVSPPIGSIQVFAGSTAPAGYFLCQGQSISRTTYADLFAIIGTTYGAGDGSTTFNLPNLKGRVPVGFDSGQTEFNNLGETGGEKTHTLSVTEMPSHNHELKGGGSPISLVTGGSQYRFPFTADGGMTQLTSDAAGGGAAHNNLQPYISMNYIIKF